MCPFLCLKEGFYETEKKVLLTCTSLILLLPSVTSAGNSDVPFYDGNETTILASDELQLKGKLLRSGSRYKPKEFDYKADIHFPAVYNGSFNWGIQGKTLSKMKTIQILMCVYQMTAILTLQL